MGASSVEHLHNSKQMSAFVRAPVAQICCLFSVLAYGVTALVGGPIAVPQGSFESPATEFADPRIDSWQETPKPDWYDEQSMGPWSQLTGVFKNTPLGSEDHIANTDGEQALFLFAVPGAGVFQDYASIDWNGTTEEFDFVYEPGQSYELTVGVLGGLGGMQEGASITAALYYRNAQSEMQTIAATNIIYQATPGSEPPLFTDHTVSLPSVRASDPWAGMHIGIQLVSTVTPELAGGYWDLDNVRLQAVGGPVIQDPSYDGHRFQLLVQGEVGSIYEVFSSTDVSLPTESWMSLGTVTNTTGTVSFADDQPNLNGAFYRALQLE